MRILYRRALWISLSIALVLSAIVISLPLATRAQEPTTQRITTPSGAIGTAFLYQGTLYLFAQPANGSFKFEFSLYDAPTGGNRIGGPITKTVIVSNAFFTTSLDFGDVFDGNQRWLEIYVLEPSSLTWFKLGDRQPLMPVPYALYARKAGSVPWSGLTGLPAGFADNTDNDTLGALSCSDGQVAKWNGSAWTCADDNGTAYTAGTGLVLSNGVFSLGTSYRLPQGCANGQIPEWDGSQWVCGNDDTGGTSGGNFWALTGNSGTNASTNFLGTTDNMTLTVKVSNTTGLRIGPSRAVPNIVGGFAGNSIAPGVTAATIGGGGREFTHADYACVPPRAPQAQTAYPCINEVSADNGTVSGGYGNHAGGFGATVGGGFGNWAMAPGSSIGGGSLNHVLPIAAEPSVSGPGGGTIGGGGWNSIFGRAATIGGGFQNMITGSATISEGLESTIAGGGWNHIYGSFDTIGGGFTNTITGTVSTIAGGMSNKISADNATVGGGSYNSVKGNGATISGGQSNTADGASATVGGGVENSANGAAATVSGGSGNMASGNNATVGGGVNNTASGANATISGGSSNQANANGATVGGGTGNSATGDHASVSAGWYNTASNPYDTVGGGAYNTANGGNATVSGGMNNTASGPNAAVGGGVNNVASGNSATISGGTDNQALGYAATVSGGETNVITTTAQYGSVGGGIGNTVKGYAATIGGGETNSADGGATTIGGGSQNIASGDVSTIGGGQFNVAESTLATIGGGEGNNASGYGATISGGSNNATYSDGATVGGGFYNTAVMTGTTISGGENNRANGMYATVGGGDNNIASGGGATVGGGSSNLASGDWATIPGGADNIASGAFSFAAGWNAKATHDGSFVWGDSTNATISSAGANTFVVRANGGIWLGQATTNLTPTIGSGIFLNTSTGAYLSTGGTWTNASDRNVKENFAPVDPQMVLEKVANLPIQTWNYKAQDERIRHMGPTAQDFYAAFGLGEDEKHISTVDADGVALAAIQGLYQQNQELQARIAQLEAQNAALEARIEALERGRGWARTANTTPWLLLGIVGLFVVARRRQES